MTLTEAFWISQLILIAGAALFVVEDWNGALHGCGTIWETVTTLGASCPT